MAEPSNGDRLSAWGPNTRGTPDVEGEVVGTRGGHILVRDKDGHILPINVHGGWLTVIVAGVALVGGYAIVAS